MAQRPSLDLASMLPGPRAGFGDQPLPPPPPQQQPLQEMPSIGTAVAAPAGSEAERRRERRRLAQLSPGEGRNSRPSGSGEAEGALSPTRTGLQGRTNPASGAESEVDMSRYGLAVDSADPSPVSRSRRRMSAAGGQSPEPRGTITPSDQGSDVGSPTRRMGSRTDLRSSYDSLDSLAAAQVRPGRRGSGFKHKHKGSKGGAAPKPQQHSVADVHIVGEIVGASGFNYPMLFCRWQLLYEPSKSWQVLRGLQQGATHACCAEVSEVDMVVWEHPLDIHMQTQSLQGWPALLLMVYSRDESTGRDAFVSYALINLPTSPGMHRLSSNTWFALESNRALGRSFFEWHTGLIPRLEDETFITDLRKREDAGPFICTVGAGEVHLRIGILTKNLETVTHEGGESLAAALERLTNNILRQSTHMANKTAALEEHRRAEETLTEGQKLVRGGREERLASARAAIDSRRRDGASPLPSESSRTSMLDQGGRSSFRGFGGGRAAASPRGQDDLRSEASFDRGGGGYTPPRDRYADRLARRARDKATSQDGGSAGGADDSNGGAAGAGGDGASAPPSRGPSTSGTAAALSRAASRRAASSSGAAPAAPASGGGGGRRAGEDDGLESIDGDEAATGGGASEDGGAGRAAERAARRAQKSLAF